MSNLINQLMEGFISILSAPVKAMLKNAIGGEQLKSIIKFLRLAASSKAGKGAVDYANFFTIVNSIFNALKPIGFALIATFFIIHVIGLISKESLTLEVFIKALISLVLVITIAANSDKLMNAVMNIGETVLNVANGAITSKDPGGIDDIVNKASEKLVASYGMGSLFIAFLVWLVHQFVVIGIDVAAFSRIIDIGWRAACMPIGIANSFEGGVNSAGVKFFKGFVSSVLSGAVMLIICAVGFSLAASILSTGQSSIVDRLTMNGFWTLIVETIAIELATMGAAIAAPNKTKELLL